MDNDLSGQRKRKVERKRKGFKYRGRGKMEIRRVK